MKRLEFEQLLNLNECFYTLPFREPEKIREDHEEVDVSKV